MRTPLASQNLLDPPSPTREPGSLGPAMVYNRRLTGSLTRYIRGGPLLLGAAWNKHEKADEFAQQPVFTAQLDVDEIVLRVNIRAQIERLRHTSEGASAPMNVHVDVEPVVRDGAEEYRLRGMIGWGWGARQLEGGILDPPSRNKKRILDEMFSVETSPRGAETPGSRFSSSPLRVAIDAASTSSRPEIVVGTVLGTDAGTKTKIRLRLRSLSSPGLVRVVRVAAKRDGALWVPFFEGASSSSLGEGPA
ncbi:hypothetical protein BDK51DRAFT_30285 [Blyttiomyces helicus]|uniref:Uncharacterized protein n=1 Tax=Blyttiomyces helicus TaxID=388810 RepID=A0A4P9W751_9FUNG|nr:hypothetical protein BDK51DRAFT_30285 [Blyttiomyces helicus]|eukprot:RKO88289.1 hypothetical protein BDK51DRAFT_30285 [Blyttiomyces helicus]